MAVLHLQGQLIREVKTLHLNAEKLAHNIA